MRGVEGLDLGLPVLTVSSRRPHMIRGEKGVQPTAEPWQALMRASYGLSPGLISTPERSSNLFPASATGNPEAAPILLSLLFAPSLPKGR
jgi:hypothetical protein